MLKSHIYHHNLGLVDLLSLNNVPVETWHYQSCHKPNYVVYVPKLKQISLLFCAVLSTPVADTHWAVTYKGNVGALAMDTKGYLLYLDLTGGRQNFDN